MKRKVEGKQVKRSPKKVIIVTGPSGSGKTRVAHMLAGKGFRLIRGDEIARSLYAPGKPAWRRIRREFGEEYFRAGRLDRKKMGMLVFSSAASLKRLNAILHPELVREIRRRLVGLRKACVDMAVYFQAGAPDFGGLVVLVDAPLKLRVSRLLERGMEPTRARAQAKGLSFGRLERSRCDAVIVNSAGEVELQEKVDGLLDLFFNGYGKKS